MARFGLAERHAALADGLWRELSESDELEDLKVLDDLAAALARHPAPATPSPTHRARPGGASWGGCGPRSPMPATPLHANSQDGGVDQ